MVPVTTPATSARISCLTSTAAFRGSWLKIVAMRTLTLGKLRRAHVWIGEVPPAIYKSHRVLARTWTNCRGGTFAQQKAAVELFVPTGPKSMYGLLGAEVTRSLRASVRTIQKAVLF